MKDFTNYDINKIHKLKKSLKKGSNPKIILFNAPKAPEIKDLNSLINLGKTRIPYQNINFKVLWDILPELEELNNLIGLTELKETIFYQIIYYLQKLHEKSKDEYLHTVILGSPGTGKTTVAKIMGEIYKKLKVLSENGIFKIAKREDMVGEYLGQTAVKTKKLLESCKGGVLFIDEAYALGPGQKDRDSYSKECIDTLNAFLSENKDNFCCIIAGYEEEVKKCFFSVNPGLERRFQWVHRIKEYSNEDLSFMCLKKIKDINWSTDLTIQDFTQIIDKNKDLFKNFGGDIENLIGKSKLSHAKRVFSLDPSHKFIITIEDIEGAIEYMKNNKLKDIDKFDKPPPMMYL
jgi:SpoVK/Ycf46/Vps4 family AAA+-type ATPase